MDRSYSLAKTLSSDEMVEGSDSLVDCCMETTSSPNLHEIRINFMQTKIKVYALFFFIIVQSKLL